MTKAWADFNDFVLPEVPGCTPERAALAVKNAALDFIERAQVWRENLNPVSTVEGQADYEFYTPEGAVLVRPISATLDGEPLEILTDAGIEATEADDLEGIFTRDMVNYTLHPTPEEADLYVVVYAALRPTQAATGIDDALYERFAREISWGALAELLRSPEKPYTNMALAQYYADKFEVEIHKRKNESEFGHKDNTARSGFNYLAPVI